MGSLASKMKKRSYDVDSAVDMAQGLRRPEPAPLGGTEVERGARRLKMFMDDAGRPPNPRERHQMLGPAFQRSVGLRRK